MIPSVRQPCEARAYDATGNFAVPGDDGTPLVDWDLDGIEDLGPALAAQFALTGSAEIADPFGLAVRRHQIVGTTNFDGNDGTLLGSPVRRPTTVRVAPPWAFSLMASGLANLRVKAGGFK